MNDAPTAAMPTTATIAATHGLALRALRQDDGQRIAALAGDFEVARMTLAIPHPYGQADAEAFIAAAARPPSHPKATFALEQAGEGLVGVVGFRGGEGLGPEIGYWVGRPYWGRGLATAALRAALAWSHEAWRARSVTAGVFIDNPASFAVLIKAGFLPTGRLQLSHCAARGQTVPSRRMIWLA